MRITYVMMQYPLPTQTFAMSDIATLGALGHEVTIECLLPARKAQRELCDTYQLDRTRIHNASFVGYLAGIPLAVKYLVQNRLLFAQLIRQLVGHPKRLLAFLALLPRIADLTLNLSKAHPDVVHAFWGHWPSVVPALLNRYAPGVRTSMHMGAYDLYAGFPLHVTAALVDDCFTHSLSNLPLIKEMGVDREVRMIHRGIPLADLLPDVAAQPIPKVELQFCTASSLTKDKKVDETLRVFALIRRQFPDATLMVAGDGAERQSLEALATELGIDSAVRFVGYVKRQELFCLMCASQFFLFLSGKVSERLPNVVKEAMLARCVCFVSNTQGIEELIQGADFGTIVRGVESAEIAREVIAAMNEQMKNCGVGDKAHDLVATHFSSESAMARYVKIWTTAAA